MSNFKGFDEINVAVSQSGDVLTVTMSELRDANGSGRLGPYVVEAISKELAGKGLGHYPPELPQNQWEKARLYRLGSQIADLINMVTNVTEANDEKLREVTTDDAQKTLNEVRRIVGAE